MNRTTAESNAKSFFEISMQKKKKKNIVRNNFTNISLQKYKNV